jgi:hypothetical protein
MITSDILLLPHEKAFDETLGWHVPPGHPPECNFIVRADGSGILEPASFKQTQEYLEGGEYQERLQEIGSDGDDWDEIVIDIPIYL